MKWNSVEIEPKENKVYLVLGFDKMHYMAHFSKRNKWTSFTHYTGPIDEDSNWGRVLRVRGWIDIDGKPEIIFPNQPERLSEKTSKEDAIV